MKLNFLISKQILVSFLLGIVFFGIFGSISRVFAQQKPVVDLRCPRERLFNRDSCYVTGERTTNESGSATEDFSNFTSFEINGENIFVDTSVVSRDGGCNDEGNNESFILALESFCNGSLDPDDHLTKVSVIETDIALNRRTIPFLIQMGLTGLFVVLAIAALWTTFRLFLRWNSAAFSGGEMKTATQSMINGMIGVLLAVAAIPVTSAIFYVAGFRDSVFDFGETLDRVLEPNCGSVNEQKFCLAGDTAAECTNNVNEACDAYDVSCTFEAGECQNISSLE